MTAPPSTTDRNRVGDRIRQRLDRRQAGLVLSALWVVVALTAPWADLDGPGRRMLAVFGVAVVLWITEAIPLYATAVVIILAEIALISDEAIWALPDGFEPPSYTTFYAALAHPVLMLFLGGFLLADGAAKYRLDRNLAGAMLAPFGNRPASLMAGLMAITAVLSMFMSNTATTASMMAVVLPVVAGLGPDDPLRTSLALSVPVAANIGGLGTPVGTPPNAIALGRLNDEGIRIDFLTWMVLAVPVVVVVLGVAWMYLNRVYPARTEVLELQLGGEFDRSRPARVLYATFALTVLLWLSEPLHGIPSTVVGFVPVVLLLAFGVMTSDDLRRLNWHVLWLVGGGIALGLGVSATGLDLWLVGLIDWSALPTVMLTLVLVTFALTMSTVISNSATANLMIPIGVSLAASDAIALTPALTAVLIAVACSLAMALPVSTPPNAIAHATGLVESRDLARVGAVVGAVGSALVVVVAPALWRTLGLVS